MKIAIRALRNIMVLTVTLLLAACAGDDGWDGTSGIVDDTPVPIRLTLAGSVSVSGTQGEPWGLGNDGLTRAASPDSDLPEGTGIGIFIIDDATKQLIDRCRTGGSAVTVADVEKAFKAYGYANLKAECGADKSLTWVGETPYYPLRRDGKDVSVWIIAYAPYVEGMTLRDMIAANGWRHPFADEDGNCDQTGSYAAHDLLIGYAGAAGSPSSVIRTGISGQVSVRFMHAMSLVRFDITNKSASSLTGLSVVIEGISGTANVDLFGSCTGGTPVAPASSDDTMTLTVTSGQTISAAGSTSFYCVIPPQTAPEGANVTVSYEGSDEDKATSISGREFVLGTTHVFSLTKGAQ